MSAGRWAAIIVLLAAGIYFVVWHYPPLPGNHEAWLGTNHIVHAVIGIVLIIGAVWIWRSGRRPSPAPATPP